MEMHDKIDKFRLFVPCRHYIECHLYLGLWFMCHELSFATTIKTKRKRGEQLRSSQEFLKLVE